MTTKALRKQLVAAIAMVLVAAVALGSSTYAWFAMNTTVNATGMQVTAKTDNTFLLIGGDTENTAALVQAQIGTDLTSEDLTVAAADADLYPASPALDATEAAYLTTSGKTVAGATITTAGVIVDNATKAAAVTNWFTANALAPSAAAIDDTTAKQLTTFTDYVIHKVVYITVAAGANNANNLTVTPTIAQKAGGSDVSAVKVLVVTDDGACEVLDSTSGETDIKGSNTAITPSTVRQVDIYIYYDGDETPVYTNNAANLAGADIDLQFDVDAVPAGA